MVNILIIENHSNDLDKISQYLNDQQDQIELRECYEQDEVLEKVHERLPDVIILESNFNNNKGIDFCYRLKNKSITNHTPLILVFNADSSSEKRTKGMLAGADAIISRPINKAELVAVINMMIRIKEAEDQLRRKNKELSEKIKQTKEEFSKKEKRYADMFDAAANIIILIGKNKRIEEWNKAAENIFEIAREDAIGRDFEKIILNKVMRADINDKITYGDKIDNKNEYQINIKNISGKKYQVLWTISQLMDSKNKLSSILVIGQDVSWRVKEEQERKRSEAKLLKNYLFLDALINTLPSPIYYKSVEGQYLGCNAGFADFMGLKREKIIGKYTSDINPTHLASKIVQEDMQVFSTGKKQIKEVSSKYKDGKMHYFLLNKTAFYNLDRSVGGLVGIMVEITRQKQMEEELRESEMFFKGITDSANDAIILIDKNYKIHFWNKAAELFFGYKKEEVMNDLLYKIFSNKQNKDLFIKKLNNIQQNDSKTAQSNIFELEAIHKNKRIFSAEFSISNIKLRHKTFSIIIAKDITLRKKTQSELLEAKERAEEADRLKSAFLSNMSHEIRTPMNAIVGFSQLLASPTIDEEKRNIFIEQINLNSDSLLQLIEDIIYVSKIEAGKIEINKTMCLLNSMLDELEISFIEHKRRMSKEHLKLKVIKSIDNPAFSILTDNQRFKQILTNLIGNAIKFTEAGSITFGYEVKDENMLLFFVKDTGLGINKEKIKYVFDRFTKISANKTRLYGGTGLGLSITQHLVERLGGTIWVESEENKGSVFYFTIPHQGIDVESKPQALKKEIPKRMNLENINILIAEDEQMNFYFLKETLLPTGANLEWAKNGLEAVKLIESKKTFHIILMDMKMPVMDGYEATLKIKKLYPHLPVIAQTAYAMPEEQKKGYQAGCDYYLSKPIDPDILIDTIQKYLMK